MYNKGQTRVLFILINSIIDTTVIQLLVYHMATIRQPKINTIPPIKILITKIKICIQYGTKVYPIWNHYVYNTIK